MSTLSERLAMLAASDDSFENNPYEDIKPVDPPKKSKKKRYSDDTTEPSEPKVSVDEDIDLSILAEVDEDFGKRKKKAKLSDREKMKQSVASLNKYQMDTMAAELDRYLDFGFEDDEDSSLTNSLIAHGRKYARDTAMSAEGSEISKAFAGSEKKLKALLDEITEDKEMVDEVLSRMRQTVTRNYKSMADLMAGKNSYHSTQLSIIKELNSIKKTQFELKMKEAAAKKDNDQGSVDSSNLIKSLFGMDRAGLMDSIGGYEAVSGSTGSQSFYDEDSPEETFLAQLEEEEASGPLEDGDKFLKYEGKGVQLVLIESEDDNGLRYDVIAEDSEGNYVPDYPLPSNIEQLHFDINRSTGEATDDLKRTYLYRRED